MRIKGIARYTHIINPSAPRGSEDKRWSISILIHKSDPLCAQVTAAVDQAKLQGFPSGMPGNSNVCWVDCAIDEPTSVALKDYMSLSANTKCSNGNKPHFVDSSIQPIIDPAADGNTDGMVVFADVGIASYNQVSTGIKAYLNGVMVTTEAGAIPRDALTSRPDAASMFAECGVTEQPAQSPASTMAPPPVASLPPTAPPSAPAQPQFVMTNPAGPTRDAYHQAGWSDDQLIQHGHMTKVDVPPASFQ